jgi:hypothetical protein
VEKEGTSDKTRPGIGCGPETAGQKAAWRTQCAPGCHGCHISGEEEK